MTMEGEFFHVWSGLIGWFVDIHFSVPLRGKKTAARNVGLTGIRMWIWIWDFFWLSVLHISVAILSHSHSRQES